MKSKTNKSTLRLFKGIVLKNISDKIEKELIKKTNALTVKYGFVFEPKLISSLSESVLNKLIDDVIEVFGLTGKQLNASFHKSWGKVKNSEIKKLVIEQLIHYFTTYGLESLGLFNEDYVFIPKEKLKIPELKDDFKFVIIKALKPKEVRDKIFSLITSGIALSKKTIEDIFSILNDRIIDKEFFKDKIDDIKNREVKLRFYDLLGITPEEPIEFLRYVVFLLTGNTLLIKSNEVLVSLQDEKNFTHLLFEDYKKQFGLEKLAQIFYRFKPIFLSLKKHNNMSSIVNKIRKLAIKYHKPFQKDFLNSITELIKKGEEIDLRKLKFELSKVDVFRKVRLVNTLRFRLSDTEFIGYKIRNGKIFVKDFIPEKNKEELKKVIDVITKDIVSGLKKKLSGKKILLPKNITYALPTSEKQFLGFVPFGSFVETSNHSIFGVNWFNVKGHRIDLDLSMTSLSMKIGWDGLYRNEERKVLFSGDMTNASGKNGATELFYVNKKHKGDYIVSLNYFNYNENITVPFSLFVAEEKIEKMKRNYVVNPNNVLFNVKTEIKDKQIVLGFFEADETNKFYFTNMVFEKSISSRLGENNKKMFYYLKNFFNSILTLNKVLKQVDCEIITEKKDYSEDEIIDLSYKNIEKNTLIDLIK